MGLIFPKADRETDKLPLLLCLVCSFSFHVLHLELPGAQAWPHRKGTTVHVQTHHRLLAKQAALTKIYTFPGSWPTV